MVGELGGVEELLQENTEVSSGAVGLRNIILGSRVESGVIGVKGDAQVAFDGGDRGTHFVGGGRNKGKLLVTLADFIGDVAEDDNNGVVGLRIGNIEKDRNAGFLLGVEDFEGAAGEVGAFGEGNANWIVVIGNGVVSGVKERDDTGIIKSHGIICEGEAGETEGGRIDEANIAEAVERHDTIGKGVDDRAGGNGRGATGSANHGAGFGDRLAVFGCGSRVVGGFLTVANGGG